MPEHEIKTGKKRNNLIVGIVAAIVVIGCIGGVSYWYVSSKTIYIDQSIISAPVVNLSPINSGILEALFVKEGDAVAADTPVARVGDEIVKAKTDGTIVSVNNNIGQFLNVLAGQGVVASMINPSDLRVVGHLEEDKGLAYVSVGEAATFTVDAYGGKTYQGVVDEVSPTSRASDVVFNISTQRPTNEFDVKVRFDPAKYPELKNGMSARIWIYKP